MSQTPAGPEQAYLLCCQSALLALVSALDAYLNAPGPQAASTLAHALEAAHAALRATAP